MARELDVEATPTLVINGRRMVGIGPLPEIRKVIDAALAER